jgi:hypothetical protein
MKPEYIKYGGYLTIIIILVQWMTGTFDDGQTKMLENQNMMITTLEHSNYVQQSMLKEMEEGNNLTRRRLGIRIKD